MTTRHVGVPLKRLDGPRLLSGGGKYVDDLALPRMVHVAFVRSPHAHARLTRVDVAVAREMPGVVAALTGQAVVRLCRPYRGVLLHYQGMKTAAMQPLATERVRYVGEPVVASRVPARPGPRARRPRSSMRSTMRSRRWASTSRTSR